MGNNKRVLSLLMAVLGSVSSSMAAGGRKRGSKVRNVSNTQHVKSRNARSQSSKKTYALNVDDKTKVMKHKKNGGKKEENAKTAKTFAVQNKSASAVEEQKGWSTGEKLVVGLPSGAVGVGAIGAVIKSVSERKSWTEFMIRANDLNTLNCNEYSMGRGGLKGKRALFSVETPGSWSKGKLKYHYVGFYFVDKNGNLKLAYKKNRSQNGCSDERRRLSQFVNEGKTNGKIAGSASLENETVLKENLVDKMASSMVWREGVIFHGGLVKDVIKSEIPEKLGGKPEAKEPLLEKIVSS